MEIIPEIHLKYLIEKSYELTEEKFQEWFAERTEQYRLNAFLWFHSEFKRLDNILELEPYNLYNFLGAYCDLKMSA